MNFLRKYNTAATIVFPLYDPTGAALTTGATFAAGDVKIIKDEGASANTTNLPAHEGNGLYSLALTSTEMTAARIGILVDDQTSPELWLGIGISIDTYGNASAGIVFDLSQATPAADVTKWLGTAAATPTVAGVPEVDVTHWLGTAAATPTIPGTPVVDTVAFEGGGISEGGYTVANLKVNVTQVDGAALDTHDAGAFPSDLRLVAGTAVATAVAGYVPADSRRVDGASLATHASGAYPADIVAVNNEAYAASSWGRVFANTESLSVTTQISASSFSATGAAATTDGNYVDRVGIFNTTTTTLALRGRPFYVTVYTGATKTFVVDLLTATPVVGDTFLLLP